VCFHYILLMLYNIIPVFDIHVVSLEGRVFVCALFTVGPYLLMIYIRIVSKLEKLTFSIIIEQYQPYSLKIQINIRTKSIAIKAIVVSFPFCIILE
jgi:hypothetical protein